MASIEAALKDIYKKVFNVREGEIETVLLMQLLIFLLISTLLIVKPTVNALFLSNIGVERLPEVYILVALSAIFTTTLYTRFLNKTLLSEVIVHTLYISIVILLIYWALFFFGLVKGWILYLFFIWVSIFGVLSASQFWVLANLVFNIREAKRLFSVVGTGAIAGGIFGGYLTTLLAPMIGAENMLFVAIVFLALCIPLLKHIWIKNINSLSEFMKVKRNINRSSHPFKLILNSTHLSYLASIVGISIIVAKLVDYQFSDLASRNIEDADELSAFFGFWFSNFNLMSLFIQLFLTNRVVGRWGIGSSLLFLPLSILFGALLIIPFPALWTAVLLKSADGSLKQSINKSGMELLALPLPTEIKNKTKVFIDVVIDSLATGVAGIILLLVVRAFDLSTITVSLIIISLIAVWIRIVFYVKKEYVIAFKAKVEEKIGTLKKKRPVVVSEVSIKEGIAKVLQNGTEKQLLYMLGKCMEHGPDPFFDQIIPLLDHPSSLVKTRAIEALYFCRQRSALEQVKELLIYNDLGVKQAAFSYLIEHTDSGNFDWIMRYIANEDKETADAALLALVVELRDNIELREKYKVEQLIQGRIDTLQDIPDEARVQATVRLLKIVGQANIDFFHYFIRDCLQRSNDLLVRQAIISAGASMNPIFIGVLVKLLDNKQLRPLAMASLLNYGSAIIEKLYRIVNTEPLLAPSFRFIPEVIQQFRSQKAIDYLFLCASHVDRSLKKASILALKELRSEHGHLRINNHRLIVQLLSECNTYVNVLKVLYAQILKIKSTSNKFNTINKKHEARVSLITLLERRLEEDFERIFLFLGLIYPPEDVQAVYKGINSGQEDTKMNALEFLDNLLTSELKKALIPLVEANLLDSLTDEVLQILKLDVPDDHECFRILLQLKDQRIILSVLFLIGELKDPRFLELVIPLGTSNNEKIADFANIAVKKIG